MHQSVVRVGILTTAVLWAIAGLSMAAGWVVWLFGGSAVASTLLGLTGAVFIGPATVAHCRLYAARLAFIIRSTAAVNRPDVTPPTELRSVN